MKNTLNDLQFVQVTDGGIQGFGFVMCDALQNTPTSSLALTDMADDFGVYDVQDSRLTVLGEEDIKKNLAVVACNQKDYPYFIIQLNDIAALQAYHIEETALVQNLRETNEVLNG